MLAQRFRLTAYAPASALIVTFILAGCASTPHQPSASSIAPAASQPAAKPLPPATPPKAETIKIKPTAPKHYVVKKGDTLWAIAERFLQSPWNWPEIWYDNPHIKNPHWIYPGDVLTLYYVNGQPRIMITGGPRIRGLHTVVLKPSIEYKALPKTEHPIPIQAIAPFLVHPRVIPIDMFNKAPHIVAAADRRILYSAGDRVYVRGLSNDDKASWYSVYRPGEILKDPKTGKVIGHQVVYLGDIHLLQRGKIATGMLEHTKRAITPGDRLLPLVKKHYDYTFFPHAPKANINAFIISLFGSMSMVGQYQVVVLDSGTKDGLTRGDVLAVDQVGRTMTDHYASRGESTQVHLPNERIGLVMVFRTFKRISYALVMSSTSPMTTGDLVHNP